jgi:flagellar motility protein MotE (MotC chaperone)
MQLKVLTQPDGRYALWSTRVDGVVIEDATRAEIVDYYLAKKPDGSAAEIERLVDRADERSAARPGERCYEEAPEFLSGR